MEYLAHVPPKVPLSKLGQILNILLVVLKVATQLIFIKLLIFQGTSLIKTFRVICLEHLKWLIVRTFSLVTTKVKSTVGRPGEQWRTQGFCLSGVDFSFKKSQGNLKEILCLSHLLELNVYTNATPLPPTTDS